jgi:hypothetical protein
MWSLRPKRAKKESIAQGLCLFSAVLNRPRRRPSYPIIPYPTERDAFPGTSCQATIGVVPTGRAGRHLAAASSESLLPNVPEGRCDHSLARSAWKNATQKSRPVGYGVIEYEGRRRGREGLGQDANRSWCQKVGQMSRVFQVQTTGRFEVEDFAKHILEICERCRLKQQNSPATPENSTTILEKRVSTISSHLIVSKRGS